MTPVLAAMLAASALYAPPQGVALRPCTVPGWKGPARCAMIEVPEDRAAPGGRRIPLRVVVLPARGPAHERDPIFVLSGGPGQAAADVAAEVADELGQARRSRDLVLVDQRGTGGSNRLSCRPFADDDPRLYFGSPDAAAIRKCREELSSRADLTKYTTDAAAEDLEEVRARLGYPRIDLDAGSYGTRLALLYLGRHPARVRSAVLKGVNAPSLFIPLPFARAGQEALERLFADCEAEAACAARFPDLRREFEAVLARLDQGPVKVEVENPVTGKTMTASIDRAAFASRVHLLLFSSSLAARLPLLVHEAHEGRWAPFASLAAAFGKAIADRIDFGMQLSVLCAEDLPFITPEEVERETAGTFLGPGRILSAQRFCAEWPRGRAAPDLRSPVRSDVPVLLVSGAYDPATPPRFAEEVAAGLPRSRHVVLRGSHVDGRECAGRMASAFFAAGSAEGLDVSCAAEVKRPPFVLEGEVPARRKP